MIKTGEILRKTREAKGLSLNEAALSLKISSKILKAIEDGNSAQLPAKTFLRGFVQSYAIFLRLDVDSIMAIFYEEMGSTKPKALVRVNNLSESTASNETTEKIATTLESPDTKPIGKTAKNRKVHDPLAPINQTSNTKTVVITIIGAILIGLILFTKKMIDKYSKEAQVETIEVLPSAPPIVPLPEPVVALAPEKPAEPKASSAKVEAPTSNMSISVVAPTPAPAPNSSSPISSPKPSASPSPTPAHIPTPSPTSSPSPSPTPTVSPSPEATEKPMVNKPIELIIEALDNVEIEYSSNAGKKSILKLSSEQVHTFKSKNGLKLNISNGGAVNLILNGRDLGIPGDLGKPIKLSY